MNVKKVFSIILVLSSYFAKSQEYSNPSFAIESLGGYLDMSELFLNHKSFKITQLKRVEKKDSLQLVGGCMFYFIDNNFIKTNGYNQQKRLLQSRYWKWESDEKGTEYSYIIEYNRSGTKKKYTDKYFKTSKYIIIKEDSIVDVVDGFVDKKKDTAYSFRDRYIYREGKLKEAWSKNILGNKLDWGNNYSIKNYSYPSKNVVIVESSIKKENNIHTLSKIQNTRLYNENGKIKSIESLDLFSANNIYDKMLEDYYYDKNNSWYKTEYWNNGVLDEVIIKSDY